MRGTQPHTAKEASQTRRHRPQGIAESWEISMRIETYIQIQGDRNELHTTADSHGSIQQTSVQPGRD